MRFQWSDCSWIVLDHIRCKRTQGTLRADCDPIGQTSAEVGQGCILWPHCVNGSASCIHIIQLRRQICYCDMRYCFQNKLACWIAAMENFVNTRGWSQPKKKMRTIAQLYGWLPFFFFFYCLFSFFFFNLPAQIRDQISIGSQSVNGVIVTVSVDHAYAHCTGCIKMLFSFNIN